MSEQRSNDYLLTLLKSARSEDIEEGHNSGYTSNLERTTSPTEAPLQRMADGENDDGDGDAVDLDKWVISLTRILEGVPQYMCNPGHPGRISRIPENLRAMDFKAYEPFFLSIGPYHREKPQVQQMEKKKQLVLKSVLQNRPELNLKDYLLEIKSIEPIARSFYTDIRMDSKKFVQMLLLDGIYIVTLFCGMAKSQHGRNPAYKLTGSREDRQDINQKVNQTEVMLDEVKSNKERSRENNVNVPRWFWILLAHDLFLLENQIPFFVLQKIHDLLYGGSDTQLIGIMKNLVGNRLSKYMKVDSSIVFSPTQEIHHLLHTCLLLLRPTLQQESTTSQPLESTQMFRLGNAVQLYKAGVQFEARSRSDNYSLVDITFDHSGKMIMPCLYVDDNTDSLLRNLIALEQMKYPSMGLNVSAYVVLLLHLVTIPEDVALLRRKGIIQHHLASDKEMMYLVNRLGVGLSFDYAEDNYCLKQVFQELKRYSQRRVPRWKAWIKHRHLRNPWTLMSLLAASLLLILSIVQTYYAVLSYYHPFS